MDLRGLTGNHEPGVRGTFHGITSDVMYSAASVGRMSIGGSHREDEQFSSGQHMVLLACRQKQQQSQRVNILQPVTRKESFAKVSKNLIRYR